MQLPVVKDLIKFVKSSRMLWQRPDLVVHELRNAETNSANILTIRKIILYGLFVTVTLSGWGDAIQSELFKGDEGSDYFRMVTESKFLSEIFNFLVFFMYVSATTFTIVGLPFGWSQIYIRFVKQVDVNLTIKQSFDYIIYNSFVCITWCSLIVFLSNELSIIFDVNILRLIRPWIQDYFYFPSEYIISFVLATTALGPVNSPALPLYMLLFFATVYTCILNTWITKGRCFYSVGILLSCWISIWLILVVYFSVGKKIVVAICDFTAYLVGFFWLFALAFIGMVVYFVPMWFLDRDLKWDVQEGWGVLREKLGFLGR